MNAKITITVPIDKLSLKVTRILEEISSEFDNLSVEVSTTAKNVISETDLLKQIEEIDKARKKLLLLDANLDDCYSILSGLVKYRTQGAEEDNAEQTSE